MENAIKNKYQYIQIGVDISNVVRTTLGPRGMNKMVIKPEGPILTNDGATIIKSINFGNPIGEIFRKLAENQESYIGDGTTTTVILAGQLLERSLELLNKRVHPTTIINGYSIAKSESIKFLQRVKFQADVDSIIKTAFGSKINQELAMKITELLKGVDMRKLRIGKVDNSDPNLTNLIDGFQFGGYTINDRMPKQIVGKVAVLDLMTNMDSAKVSLNTTEELNKYNENSKDMKKNIVSKLAELDVKCVFLTDSNPLIENYLTEKNIMTIVCYKRDMIDNICKASNCLSIGDTESDFAKYIGFASVEYEQEKRTITILNEKSEIKTLLLHGATKQVLDETERAVDDVVKLLRLTNEVVVGAGAVEIELALHLRAFSQKIGGKEQVAIDKFAEALESIPFILAENCGHDAMEVITMLKNQHSNGNRTLGVDAFKVVSDAKERNVLEPALLKIHAINSAVDVANLILKLDDIYNGAGESK